MNRAIAVISGIVLIALFVAYGSGDMTAMIVAVPVFAALIALYMGMADEGWRSVCQKWIDKSSSRIYVLPAGLVLLYLGYALATNEFSLEGLLSGALLMLLPVALVQARSRTNGFGGILVGMLAAATPLAWAAVQRWPLNGTETVLLLGALALAAALFILTELYSKRAEAPFLGAIFALWYAVEFDVFRGPSLPPSGGLIGYWHLAAIVLFLYLLLLAGRMDEIGYSWRLSKDDWRDVTVYSAVFALVGIPFGLVTGFIALSPTLPPMSEILGRGIAILFFIAIPEEILFRGALHRHLQRTLDWRGVRVLLLSSLVFGASHLNNPPQVGLYFIMATFAGYLYGRTYLRTGKVTAAAIVHLIVDWVWSIVFAG